MLKTMVSKNGPVDFDLPFNPDVSRLPHCTVGAESFELHLLISDDGLKHSEKAFFKIFYRLINLFC